MEAAQQHTTAKLETSSITHISLEWKNLGMHESLQSAESSSAMPL